MINGLGVLVAGATLGLTLAAGRTVAEAVIAAGAAGAAAVLFFNQIVRGESN